MINKISKAKLIGDYQRLMSPYENINDNYILPDLHLILRLDAHRYGDKWDRTESSRYPFEQNFYKALIKTASDLILNAGVKIEYSFIHGDEISLYLSIDENRNQRRRFKLISLVSSIASVTFSHFYSAEVVFHAKLSELPTPSHVIDYFLWQRKVAYRNFSFWLLERAHKENCKDYTRAKISALTEDQRESLLEELNSPILECSSYERFGAAIWWGNEESKLLNVEIELPPDDEDYRSLVSNIVLKPEPKKEKTTNKGFTGKGRKIRFRV